MFYTLAKFMQDNKIEITGEVLAEALKCEGYTLEEIGRVLKDSYKYGPEALNEVLKKAGYAGKDI
jgi:hypothetical protein